MAVSPDFLEFVKETLAPLGGITVKRMFGAAGIYCGDLFFAVVDDDTLYLKTDAETRPVFAAAGLAPARIVAKDGTVTEISYYAAPESVFEDEEDLRLWTGMALDAARRKAAKARPRRARNKT